MMIEGTEEEGSFWDRLKAACGRLWRRRNGHEQARNGKGKEILPRDFYYYGDYLKKVRERRGLSREDIAVRCGLSLEDIQWLEKENGASLPLDDELLQGLRVYAKCLGLDPENKGGSRPSDRLAE
jgi:ribosome-binding protein aMBF1 (putative translation factor)